MFILIYLKFAIIFLLELIRKNIIKTIFLIIAIISINYVDTFPDSIDTYKIVAETKVENTYIYVYKTITNNEVKYDNIWQEGKPVTIKDGVIKLKRYNSFNVLFWFLLALSVLLLTIITWIGIDDSNFGWEFEDIWVESISSIIYCEEENGKFYYFALGRLISKRNEQIYRKYSVIGYDLKINGFRDIYNCPKYQTKKQRRENSLKKIGIK